MLTRFLPRTLLARSLLIIVTPLILLQVVAAFIFYDSHWETVSRRLVQSLAGDVGVLVRHLRDYPGPENKSWILELAKNQMRLEAEFVEADVLPANPPPTGNKSIDEKLMAALTEHLQRPYHIDTRFYPREVDVKVQLLDGVLHVVAPRQRLYTTATYIFVLWMVGISLALFAVATFFMHWQVEPMRQLATAADSFGKGRDVPGFQPAGAAEVRQAAAAFLNMRKRIQRQISQRTEMLAGVSHDLRTPLTRMKLELAMLGDGSQIEDLKSDVSEMEGMLEGYLAFARGEGTEAAVESHVGDLLTDVVNGARRDGARIELSTNGEIVMPLRPNAFKRCITNLVGNAQRHGARVWIDARRRRDAIEITIDDDGPGIPDDRLADAFKPFYRLDPSRNPETGGVGLGLTIARDVVHSHGGDIDLARSPAGGLRAHLRLPI